MVAVLIRVLLLLLGTATPGWQASASASERPRRFALVAAQNHGIAPDSPLQYAHRDALTMAEVLRTVGGVAESDMLVLTDADSTSLTEAMTTLEGKMRRHASSGLAGHLVVYVSSHASRHRLHLNGEEFEMTKLRTFIQRMPVDVGILILDTCQAGSITDSGPQVRIKGAEPLGTSRPKVFIRRPAVKGRVIITSSGADEYSHESDKLGGSVFTHHLVVGLRGIADVSRDGNVSLAEAYEYAYVRTVGEVEQHPNWEVLLRGQGDVVLTTPRLAEGVLRIKIESSGEWLLRSTDGRRVLAEFEKSTGYVELGVPSGEYIVRFGRGPHAYLEGRVVVQKGRRTDLTRNDLNGWASQSLALKGGLSSALQIFANASIRPRVTSRLDTLFGATVGLRYEKQWRAAWMWHLSLGFAGHSGRAREAFVHNEGEVYTGAGIAWRGPIVIALTAEGGVAFAEQRYDPASATDFGLGAHLRARLTIERSVASWLRFDVSAAPGVVVYSEALFQLPVALGAAVDF